MYRKHPVGSLLVWVTGAEEAKAHGGDQALAPGAVKLLLDGQQRVTSLYGIIKGEAPRFFDGNHSAFTGLYFNLEDESFKFYSPLQMKDNPLWIDVSNVMKDGIAPAFQRLNAVPELKDDLDTYINRLGAIDAIKNIDLHVEEVSGRDKTVDVVVGIFNRVNSGGTKLSKGDLALAKVCAQWPEARDEMKVLLDKWKEAGFHFRLEWLLRCINALVTGEALFTALETVDVETFKQALPRAEKAVDSLLNLISGRLGLDHDRVLGSRYSFPLLTRYLDQKGRQLSGYEESDKLLHWYVHTFLWGRYAGSTESVLNQDLNAIEEPEGALDRLIGLLRQNRGDLKLRANDFIGWSRGARFYPLLYMLTRVHHAKDWATGIELANYMLGRFAKLELHHIFPKSLLYKHEYKRPDVNAIANFTFLTKETNLRVKDKPPHQYLEEYAEKQPGALESHWIPMDRELWRVENYLDFLQERRELLAKAANGFLDSLLAGALPEAKIVPVVPGGVESPEEEQLLRQCNEWVAGQGLPEGEYLHELVEPDTGEPLAILDLAWPDGLQAGLSQPVALLIDEEPETVEAANRAGYRYFTDVNTFQKYVQREILAVEPEAA